MQNTIIITSLSNKIYGLMARETFHFFAIIELWFHILQSVVSIEEEKQK